MASKENLVNRLILGSFCGVKLLMEMWLLFRKRENCSDRYYQLLGQLTFWLLVGYTGNAQSYPILGTSLRIEGKLRGDPAIVAQTTDKSIIAEKKTVQSSSGSLTTGISNKFPIEPGFFRKVSDSGQNRTASPLIPRSKKTSVTPIPNRIILRRQPSVSRSTPDGTRLVQAISPPEQQCWQFPIPECSYSPFGQPRNAKPPEGADPELGVLRVNPILEEEDELGSLRAEEQPLEPDTGTPDPELGTLRIQERPPSQTPDTFPTPPENRLPKPPRQASVFLLTRLDYFKSSNVFSARDPVDDGLIRSGLTLFYAPSLGPRTFLITSIDANLIRYTTLGSRNLNYDEVRYRAGIYQRLTPRVSGEIGWSNQKLFSSDTGLQQIFGGKRFFNDHSLRLELSRQDTLSPQIALNTFYQFRWSFADPVDRSRLLNSLIATLSYSFSQKIQTALDYQFTWSHFTQQSRDDLYHQVVARFTYNFTPRNQVNVFSGFSFGDSSDRAINFDSFIFGVGIVVNTPLF